mgnify:CR=1 FL=1
MNQFYICLIFTGIVLIFVAFIGILYDRKKSMDYISIVESKKRELEEALNDAEIMIQEMNRCSDYLVTLIENKYREVGSVSDKTDDREHEMPKEHALENMMGKNTGTFAYNVTNAYAGEVKKASDPIVLNAEKESAGPGKTVVREHVTIDDVKQGNKVRHSKEDTIGKNDFSAEGIASIFRIPAINNDLRREVLKLSKEGLGITEIAKRLGVGRGEIELILDINK